ncbi:psf-3, partial [Pristionchus pacificus]
LISPAMMDPNTEQDVEENFYNIDDVVALDSHVSCSFESTTPQGILQILGINQNEAGKETKAEAPLWILPTIVSHCNFRLPKAFNEEIQGVLTSHASAANLEQLQADYYTVGMNLRVNTAPRDVIHWRRNYSIWRQKHEKNHRSGRRLLIAKKGSFSLLKIECISLF